MKPNRPEPGKSFGELYPELAAQICQQTHPGEDGKSVRPNSEQTFTWRCPVADDHVWETLVVRRKQSPGCPFCTGKRLCFSNSLAGAAPEIAKDLDETASGFKADEVVVGSSKQAHWCCHVCGHTWSTKIVGRTARGTRCPACSGAVATDRVNLEALHPQIAAMLDEEASGFRAVDVRPQSDRRGVWRCSEEHTWIERVADRIKRNQPCWECRGKRPNERTSLAALHPELLEEWDADKNDIDPKEVLPGSDKLAWWICPTAGHSYDMAIELRARRGVACPYCARRRISHDVSLAAHSPAIAAELAPELNDGKDASQYGPFSYYKVWWRCSVNPEHVWRTTPDARVSGGTGCPYCARKRADATTNLAVLHTELAAEFDGERNGGLTAEDILPRSGRKVWWRCARNSEHRWAAVVATRTDPRQPAGCPHCVLVGSSEIELRLAQELSAVLDTPLGPTSLVTPDGRCLRVDIHLPDWGVCVEVDGEYWHRDSLQRDKVKSERIQSAGREVVRVRFGRLPRVTSHDVVEVQARPAPRELVGAVVRSISAATGRSEPCLANYLSGSGWVTQELSDALIEQKKQYAAQQICS